MTRELSADEKATVARFGIHDSVGLPAVRVLRGEDRFSRTNWWSQVSNYIREILTRLRGAQRNGEIAMSDWAKRQDRKSDAAFRRARRINNTIGIVCGSLGGVLGSFLVLAIRLLTQGNS